MTQEIPATCMPSWAFERYESVRHRLPTASFPQSSKHCRSLEELTDQFDAFLFDSFGVLNVGETPIAGARERVRLLRRAKKRVAVLTNAASASPTELADRLAALNFDFTRDEIISSRATLVDALASFDPGMVWGIAAPPLARVDDLNVEKHLLDERRESLDAADGFILLSTRYFGDDLRLRLETALAARPRPVLVGNPDLAAPREAAMSLGPGAIAHALADRCTVAPQFFGKPFSAVFDKAIAQVAADLPRHRIAMIGDTLHTDILGGAAAGLGTVLVTGDGMLRDLDVQTCISVSGIVPSYIIPRV